jgi:hypothetical protein
MAFPTWYRTLEKAPRAQAIAGALGFAGVVAGFIFSIAASNGNRIILFSHILIIIIKGKK